jgi:hypothetical protein
MQRQQSIKHPQRLVHLQQEQHAGAALSKTSQLVYIAMGAWLLLEACAEQLIGVMWLLCCCLAG